jgi:hypothetical protein
MLVSSEITIGRAGLKNLYVSTMADHCSRAAGKHFFGPGNVV